MVPRRRHLLAAGEPEDRGGADLTLIVRRWCSLCDAMRDALSPIARSRGLRVVEADLDAHPEWESLYAERVPVLLAGAPPEGEVVAQLGFDPVALAARLAQMPFAGRREIR